GDLFYSGLEAFEEELLSAVRDRERGESVLAAFGRFVLEPRGLLASRDPEDAERLAAIVRTIAQSPALLARERRVFAQYTESLAAEIGAELGAEEAAIEPRGAANALIGGHPALLSYARGEILAGPRHPRLARRVPA